MTFDTSITTYIGNYVVESKCNQNVTSLTPLLQHMEYEQTRKIENERIKKEEKEKVWRIQENNRLQKIKEKKLLEEHNLKIKCERRNRIGDMIKQYKLNTIAAKTRVLDAVMNKKILNSEDIIYQDLIESKVKKLLDSDTGRGKVFSCINQDRTYNIDYLQQHVSYNEDWKEFYRYNYTTNESIYWHYKKKYYFQIKAARGSNMGKFIKIYSFVISAPLLLLLYFISLVLIALSNLWCVGRNNEVNIIETCYVLYKNDNGKVWAISPSLILLSLLFDFLVLLFYFYLKKRNIEQITIISKILIIRTLLLLFLLFFFVFSIIFFFSENPVNVLYLVGLVFGIFIPLPLTFLIKSFKLMFSIQKDFIKGVTNNKTISLFIN